MTTNQAAWLPSKQAHPYKIDNAPMPTLKPDHVIVRVHAVAINPADWAVQTLGVVYTEYPVVPGCDAAGEIVEVGSAVEGFQIGDRVTVSLSKGAFQLYLAATPPLVAKIPDAMRYTEAAVLPLGMMVSTVCLFEDDMLALDRPQIKPAAANGKTVLIWGGSSSLGSCAIQLARAAGYEVAAVAGGHNEEYCRELGARHVFDYKDEDVVDQVLYDLGGKKFAGVFCAIFSDGVVGKCARIADGLGGNEFVSVIYPPGVPIPDEIPEGVKIGQCWRAALDESEAAKDIFGKWLPGALANGTMKCRPEPEIVGQGLEKIQGAVDRMKEGVSAKKLVVEIP